MALATHVTDRFGSASPFLRNLTNHDDPDAATLNSTRLTTAATDAAAMFIVHAQVIYNDADAAHIAAGVTGVIGFLKRWSTGEADPPEMVQFREALGSIAKVSSRKRITPTHADPPDRIEDLFAGVTPTWPSTEEEL